MSTSALSIDGHRGVYTHWTPLAFPQRWSLRLRICCGRMSSRTPRSNPARAPVLVRQHASASNTGGDPAGRGIDHHAARGRVGDIVVLATSRCRGSPPVAAARGHRLSLLAVVGRPTGPAYAGSPPS